MTYIDLSTRKIVKSNTSERDGSLYIRKLTKGAIAPEYNRKSSSSLTLRACTDEWILEGGTTVISLGFAMRMAFGEIGLITPAESMLKRGLFVYRETIDEDFEDEVKIIIHNSSKMGQIIQQKQVVAYLTIIGYHHKKVRIVEES
jgi:dUTPase